MCGLNDCVLDDALGFSYALGNEHITELLKVCAHNILMLLFPFISIKTAKLAMCHIYSICCGDEKRVTPWFPWQFI